VRQTADGGYIVAGGSFSNDGDVTGHHGYNIYADYWILKLDGSGNIQWRKTYGGSKGDIAMSVRQTNEGGYIVAAIQLLWMEMCKMCMILFMEISGY
jgi:hypothetical protein